jgi:hypothetical protein
VQAGDAHAEIASPELVDGVGGVTGRQLDPHAGVRPTHATDQVRHDALRGGDRAIHVDGAGQLSMTGSSFGLEAVPLLGTHERRGAAPVARSTNDVTSPAPSAFDLQTEVCVASASGQRAQTVFDHIERSALQRAAQALSAVAAQTRGLALSPLPRQPPARRPRALGAGRVESCSCSASRFGPVGPDAVRAAAAECDVDLIEHIAVALVGRQTEGIEARGMDIDESVTDRAHQMVVGGADIGVVARGPVADAQLEQFTHLDQFPKRVVDGGEGHLRQDRASPFVNVVGREVHMIAGQHLSDRAPLGRDPPATSAEAFEKRRCWSHAASVEVGPVGLQSSSSY